MNDIESWLVSVLGSIDARDRSRFSGVGLLFYTNRHALPVHALAHPDCETQLPTKSERESARLLARCSRHTSDCHDGFHLVDAETLFITDVSQFLSPPIPPEPLALEGARGARHMAARLASLLPAVKMAAVYTLSGEATLYERGNSTAIQIPLIESS